MIGDLSIFPAGHDCASEAGWSDRDKTASDQNAFVAMVAAWLDQPLNAPTPGAVETGEATDSAVQTIELVDSDGAPPAVQLEHAVVDAISTLDTAPPDLTRSGHGPRVSPSPSATQDPAAAPVVGEPGAEDAEAPAERRSASLADRPPGAHTSRTSALAAGEAPGAATGDAPETTMLDADGPQAGRQDPTERSQARSHSPRLRDDRGGGRRDAPPARAVASNSVPIPQLPTTSGAAEVTASSQILRQGAPHPGGRAEPVSQHGSPAQRTGTIPGSSQTGEANPVRVGQAVDSGGTGPTPQSVDAGSRPVTARTPFAPPESDGPIGRADPRIRDTASPQARASGRSEPVAISDRTGRPARQVISASRHPARAAFPAPAPASAAPAWRSAGPPPGPAVASPDRRVDVTITRPPLPAHSPQMQPTPPVTSETVPTPAVQPSPGAAIQPVLHEETSAAEPPVRPEAGMRMTRALHRRSTHADVADLTNLRVLKSGPSTATVSTESNRLAPTGVEIGALHTSTAPRAEGGVRTAPVFTVRRPMRLPTAELTASRPQRLTLEVDPPTLGRCELELALHDGRVRATVIAERPETVLTLRAVEGQVREQLAARNLQVAQFDVRAGTQEIGHHGSGGGAFRDDDHGQEAAASSSPTVPRLTEDAAPGEPARTSSRNTTIDLMA